MSLEGYGLNYLCTILPDPVPSPGVAESIFTASPIANSPWSLEKSDATFLGQVDPLLAVGYNVGAQGARRNAADANIYAMFEAFYKTAGNNFVEYHLDMTSVAGVAKRFLGFTIDRDDPTAYAAAALAVSALQAFTITKIADGSALVTFGGDGAQTFTPNNAHIVFNGTNAYLQAAGTDHKLTLVASSGVQVNGPVGFNSVAPLARPVLATGAGHTVDDVITVLQNYGLVSQV